MTARRQLLSAALMAAGGFTGSVGQAAPTWDDYCDLAVVGGGGAGLAAAARAAALGLKVTVFEKMPTVGGNTRLASGYISAPWPRFQKPLGISDNWEKFASDIRSNAGPTGDVARIEKLARESTRTLDWLADLGLKFMPGTFLVSGEHFPRAYKPMSANGEGYIKLLAAQARAHGTQIQTAAKVTQLIADADGQIEGIVVEMAGGLRRIRAKKGILLASGGFCASAAMVAAVAPAYEHLTHDNAPGCTGEMLLAARQIGADLVDMEKIQCQPGCPAGRTYRVRLHNEPNRFILVNHQGERFIREDARRDALRDAVMALPEKQAFIIVDDVGLRQYNQLIQKETVLGVESGDAFAALTIEDLAQQLKIPAKALETTLSHYNDAVAIQSDRLGKDMTFCSPIATPPFWACYAAMTRHASEGGVRTDADGRVLRENGTLIAGLWAAGEVTGGLHGNNQMGGNGLTDALTFGRLAAEAIARN